MSNQPNSRASFWLLSDDRLALCSQRRQYAQFKAYLKHAILFNPNLIVPDSFIVNNLNFRRAIRNDPTIRELMGDQIIKVSTREVAGGHYSLKRIRDEMLNGKKPKEIGIIEYNNNLELDYVDATAQFIPFSLSQVTQRYSQSTQALFLSDFAKQAIDELNFLDDLNRHIADELAQNAELTRAFFHYRLPTLISEKHWQRYQNTIIDMAKAHYLNNLPALLGANPVYAPDHAKAFEIVKQASNIQSLEKSAYRFTSKLSLASFVEGISLLERDHILALLDTDEAKHAHLMMSEAEENEAYLHELQLALMCYQNRIEDKILQCCPQLRMFTTKADNTISTTINQTTTAFADGFSYISLFTNVFGAIPVAFTTPVKLAVKSLFRIKDKANIDDRVNNFARDELILKFQQNDQGTIHSFAPLDLSFQETLYNSEVNNGR